MRSRSERKVFEEILSYNHEHLRKIFSLESGETFYRFIEKKHINHYVIVNIQSKPESFGAKVNADFDFARPAGSNNYPVLIKVGEYLMDAFGLI